MKNQRLIFAIATLSSLDHAVAASTPRVGVAAAVNVKNDVKGSGEIADLLADAGENPPPSKSNGGVKLLRFNAGLPSLWGRSSKSKAKPPVDGKEKSDSPRDQDESTKEDTSVTDSSVSESKSEPDEEKLESLDRDSSKNGEEKGAVAAVDETSDDSNSEKDSASSSSNDASKKEESEHSNDDANNDNAKNADAEKVSETQSTNQTRPAVLYLSSPQPGSMMPHSRPMPYPPHPYMPQPYPHNQQQDRRNPPSLLSSILSAFLPKPQNYPPPSPYGPPPSPYAPNNTNNNEVAMLLTTVLSIVLRLAFLSFTTHILDFFGMGHSDSAAFLPSPAQHYTFERINDRYRRDGAALSQALSSPPPGVRKSKWKRVFGRRKKEVAKSLADMEQLDETENDSITSVETPSMVNGALYNKTVIIIDMKPDVRVGNGMAEYLRDTISFLIEQHRDHLDKRHQANAYSSNLPSNLPSSLAQKLSSLSRTHKGMRAGLGTELEILLLLDSGGGTVQDYGLASSQLSRLRNEPHITLSVCIDRVAASGGYMMACQATPGKLYAAPFAMVGSIGVLMETVNFHEVLKKYGVNPLVIKAGKSKAPLKTLGEVTTEELQMAQKDADVIHEAFQQWVLKSRPNVIVSKDWLDKVCTGAVFLGKEAQELGLVDRIMTSDEYVAERIAAGDRVLRLIPYRGPQFGFKLSPLDLLLMGSDAEGRAKIQEKIKGLGAGVFRGIAPLFRVGSAVGVLNLVHHLASLHRRPHLSWEC